MTARIQCLNKSAASAIGRRCAPGSRANHCNVARTPAVTLRPTGEDPGVSGELRHDNPVSPPRCALRTVIYWIGCLLGLVVLAGCRSDRLNDLIPPITCVNDSDVCGP